MFSISIFSLLLPKIDAIAIAHFHEFHLCVISTKSEALYVTIIVKAVQAQYAFASTMKRISAHFFRRLTSIDAGEKKYLVFGQGTSGRYRFLHGRKNVPYSEYGTPLFTKVDL